MSENNEGMLIGHYACTDCGSSDALAVYEKDDGTFDGTCFSGCLAEGSGFKSHNSLAQSYLGDELGIEPIKREWKKRSSNTKEEKAVTTSRTPRTKRAKKKAAPLTDAQRKQVEENTSFKAMGFRGIKDKWLKFYGVRTAFDEETGEVSDRYYPCTETVKGEVKLQGYHRRIVLPKKDFRAIGLNSKESDLFGQFRCKGGKRLVITGGQEDCMAAKQMFEEYRNKRGKDNIAPVDFVSGTVGESSMAAQIQHHYDLVDKYDTILLDLDNDEAGRKAVESLLEVLPTNKTRVMEYDAKDANDALCSEMEQDYIRAIYDAKKPKIAGVVSSLDLHEKILEICDLPTISLPPFLQQANNMLCGGLPVGEITNILAGSGIGKTSIVNEFTYYWVFNSPYKIGVLSMEAGSGKYGEKLLSRHLGVNLSRMVDRDEDGNALSTRKSKKEYLTKPDVIEESNKMYATEEGEERFSLIDERGDLESIEDVKKKITQLIKGCGCRVIIIDPVTDLLDSLEISELAAFCSWLKKMKAQGVTFILINHARKGASGQKSASRGAELDEQDMQGTSALYKSGAVNVVLSRDKEHDDETERNTTYVRLTKNRDASETGKAGAMFYEFKTHRLYDKDQYINDTEGGISYG